MRQLLFFLLLSVSVFAQKQRAVIIDSDTTTRPPVSLYGLAAKSSRLYLVPRTGNVIRLLSETFPGSSYVTILGTVATGVWNATLISVSYGGTGASTAAGARTNLGLGTLATQNGTFSGTSSGTNTGDQTITLTGDATGSGTGSFAVTIANGAVSLTKMANVATGTIFYRKTASTGAPEVQTLATLKTDLGLTGTNSGDQTITLTGDVTGSGTGSFATSIANGAVSLTKMANVATGTIFYRKTASTGAPEVQTLATLKTDLGLTGTNSGDQTITLTGDVTGSGTGSFATTIANNSVSLGKMAQITTNSFLGRITAATGNIEVLSAANVKTILSLGNVENTALSTWAGTTNITTLGTITNGTWTGTVIGNAYIATALTGKTYNGLTITTSTGTLTVTNAKTASFSNTLTFAGTDGSTLNIGAGGTLNSLAFLATVNNSNWSGTGLSVANGGTGATTAQGAMNTFAGAVTSGSYLRGNGTNVVMSAIQAADIPTLNQNTTGTAANVTGTVAIANGGTGTTTAAGARTNLGATTVGGNLFTLTNPSAITFPRINADNTVSALDAATFRSAIGAGTSNNSGTVTSVSLTLPGFLSVTGSPITSSGTFAISYSGTALPIANGGTGATSAAAALSALGGVGSASPTFTGTATSPRFTGTGDGSSIGFSMNSGVAFRNTGSNFWDQGSGGSGDLYWRAGSGYTNAMTMLNNGKILISSTSDSGSGAKLQVTGGIQLVSVSAPSSASAAGTAGEIRWDASYIYVCTATNTWKRVAIATW